VGRTAARASAGGTRSMECLPADPVITGHVLAVDGGVMLRK
jgi:hypothetical protein